MWCFGAIVALIMKCLVGFDIIMSPALYLCVSMISLVIYGVVRSLTVSKDL